MTRARTDARPAPAAVPSSWGGIQLLEAFAAGSGWLEAHRDRINALNVFPVPDGDTGSNMALTMAAAVADARSLPTAQADHAGETAARLAHGALLGSRGNSGVILSQILAGFAHAIADLPSVAASDLALALRSAQEAAYRAVQKPVEGTMLTVIRVAADWAASDSNDAGDISAVLAAAHAGAAFALARTPDLLDLLRQANVVDAGGQGIVYLLEGVWRYSRGETDVLESSDETEASLGAEMVFLDQLEDLHGDDAFGYCTNFLVLGQNIDVEAAKRDLTAMGTSALIVGDSTALKVHIHTPRPGKILEYATALGDLDQVKIDNMQLQTRRLSAERAASRSSAPAPALEATRHALIAVAAGDGLADALRSMGVTEVVRGGQTENPSTEELLRAVAESPAPEAILLPNNPNILLSAARVPELSAKPVRVVPSRSIPQGIAALEGYNPDDDLDLNAARMEAAVAGVRTIELTHAVRDAAIEGVAVRNGDVVALLDDSLVASGEDDITVLQAVLDRANFEHAELATIFFGAGATQADAERLAAAITAKSPEWDIQIVPGGQPHYRYIIGVQ